MRVERGWLITDEELASTTKACHGQAVPVLRNLFPGVAVGGTAFDYLFHTEVAPESRAEDFIPRLVEDFKVHFAARRRECGWAPHA